MTSVDDLFKRPDLPSGSIKRKFEAPDPERAYKSTKLSSASSPNGHSNGQATVENAVDDDDQEAGPALPPDDEQDIADDDEEGRFFGGGVSSSAAEALNYIEEQDGDEVGFAEEKIDSAWLKRQSTSFERKVVKNAELRARHEGEPQKFMASEADLDEDIKSWSLLSGSPDLYVQFAESGSAARLVGLLAHENTDIAIAAIEILGELLDEDVEAEQEQWNGLVEALLDADLVELLMSNIARLDESDESDRNGVYHTLSVLENLAGQESVAERVAQYKVLEWLCTVIQRPEPRLSQNKQYAAEVLQILLQISPKLRKRLAAKLDGVDLYLQLLAAYRKRDPPKDSPEEEFAENLFDALTCVVDEPEGKTRFVDAEGVELVLIMLKEGDFSKSRALTLLDHAVGGRDGAREVCEKLVDAAGLKTIFGMFKKKSDAKTTEHLIGIFSALLQQLPADSAARIRTLNKFFEHDYEKVVKLLDLRKTYASSLEQIDREIEAERQEPVDDDEDPELRDAEWLSRRLDHGLASLQTIDVILAWLIAEDAGAKDKIITVLKSHQLSLSVIVATLSEQAKDAEDEDTKEMLDTLISFLK